MGRVSYGHCVKHDEDFSCQYLCNKFRHIKFPLAFKEIHLNGIAYEIYRYRCDKKTVFAVENENGLKEFYTLRDALNKIKEYDKEYDNEKK